MAAGTQHTQHLRVKEAQLDLGSDPYDAARNQDFEGKLREAQEQLELLQRQREHLEQQKCEMDELNSRKEEFISCQIEISERLTTSVTSIDRELFELRQELEDLEQTRQAFTAHLARIEKMEPEGWQRESLHAELERAHGMLEQAEEEFESACNHFAGGRTRGVFGNANTSGKARGGGHFSANFRAGLAYNLPLVVLGAAALIILLLK